MESGRVPCAYCGQSLQPGEVRYHGSSVWCGSVSCLLAYRGNLSRREREFRLGERYRRGRV